VELAQSGIEKFLDHGVLLTRSEVAGLVAVTGRRMLQFVDGGLGLIGVGDDVDLGVHSLLSRGLIEKSTEVKSGVQLGALLGAFFDVVDHRESSVEIRVNARDPGVQVSHWSIRRGGCIAIVRSQVEMGSVKFWFGLLDAEWHTRFVDALVRPRVPAVEASLNCVVAMSFEEYSKIFSAVRTRDANLIDQQLAMMSVDDLSRREFARFLKEEFSGVEITRQKQHQSLMESEQFVWLESDRFGCWEMERYPLESRVIMSSRSSQEIQARFISVTGGIG